MTSEKTPFKSWLPKAVRPVAASALLIGVAFWGLFIAVSARQNIQSWNGTVRAWTRSAEILTLNRDLLTLNTTAEHLRREYPSIKVQLRDKTRNAVLWSYPDGGVEASSKQSWLKRNISIPLGPGQEATSVNVSSSWFDIVGSTLKMGALSVLFVLLSLLLGRSILNAFVRKVIEEVDRVKNGLPSQVLEFHELVQDRERAEQEKARLEIEAQRVRIATQVAHDIGSPLAALSVIEPELKLLPDDTRVLIRSAIQRIKDIAYSLLSEKRALNDSQDENYKKTHLLGAIEAILSEKNTQYRDRDGLKIVAEPIDNATASRFVPIQSSLFKRVLSNLINNAIEAIDRSGQVSVGVSHSDRTATIKIADTGHGIPAHILHTLRERGVTYGKEGGSGLGVAHARQTLESVGGALEIESAPGTGTIVTISLPTTTPPEWFTQTIPLSGMDTIAVLDDDPSMGKFWEKRIKLLSDCYKIHLFQNGSDLRNWVTSQTTVESTLFIVDFDLSETDQDGLKWVRDLGLAERSILSTSRFDETKIQKISHSMGVKILPKNVAPFLSVS